MLISSQGLYGQNDFFFNHYMFNPSYYNPGWVGTEQVAFVAAHHRTQWAGYDATLDPGGAPTTQLVSLVVPVQGTFSGFGVSVSNDRTGPLNTVQARLAIAAKRQLPAGVVSLGVMPSLNVASLDANYRFTDPGDGLIPEGTESQFQPNLHVGVFFKARRDYFIGASVENLLQPAFDFGTLASNETAMNLNLVGGKEFRLGRELVITPSVLVRSDLRTYSFETSAIAMYQDKMWGGASFRRGEAASVLIGYSFLENNILRAGYSFDYILKNREGKQPTSHEIYIRYNLPNLVFGGKKTVKTPRFTF